MKKLSLLVVVLLYATQVKADSIDEFIYSNGALVETVAYRIVPAVGAVAAVGYAVDEYRKSGTKTARILKSSNDCLVSETLSTMQDFHFSLLHELNGPNSDEFKAFENAVMVNFYNCCAKKEKSSLLGKRTISKQDYEDMEELRNTFDRMKPNQNRNKNNN